MTELSTKIEQNNIAPFELILGLQRRYKLSVATLAPRCLTDWEQFRTKDIASRCSGSKDIPIKRAAGQVCKSIEKKFSDTDWKLRLFTYKTPHFPEGTVEQVYKEWLQEHQGEWEAEVTEQFLSLVEPVQQSINAFKPEVEKTIAEEEAQYREVLENIFGQIERAEESAISKLEAYVNAAFEYMALELLRRYDQHDFTGKMSLG